MQDDRFDWHPSETFGEPFYERDLDPSSPLASPGDIEVMLRFTSIRRVSKHDAESRIAVVALGEMMLDEYRRAINDALRAARPGQEA